MKIINLDQAVLNALDFFEKNLPPKLNLKANFPIIIGSGNAYNTGKIIASGINASESDYQKKLKTYQKFIDQAIIISASGEKDAPQEIILAKKNKLKTTLLTCSPNSTGAKLADRVITFNKLPEPYTYNTSTYLGMILARFPEDTKKIITFLKKLKPLKKFKAYAIIIPDEFEALCEMFQIKRDELFGPHVSIRTFSSGHARHAKFINRSKDELVINIGNQKNQYFGDPKSRLNIKLPPTANWAFMLCLGYYLIGKIQITHPPYFKNNIAKYCADYGPRAYGKNTKNFPLIVN